MSVEELISNMIDLKVFKTKNYKDIAILDEDKNDYTKIADAANKNGIYILYRIMDNKKEILYIGQNSVSNESWDLRKRMIKHFVESNTGGILYKLGKNKLDARKIKEKFIKEDVKLGYLILESNNIKEFERLLIKEINPKYNNIHTTSTQ